MNKLIMRAAALGLAAAAGAVLAPDAQALGWPANYQGVMLQGFSWDSYSDTKWTNLESQADELSQYFKLIWIPNSGSCGGGNNMGYMPQYWFTNHNSSFGTEAQLISMINTFKAKGTGMIADCVINHRNGVTNWTDFPSEEWNGRTWHIGTDGICCTDEVAGASGQARPTGAPDTGDDFNGARDLDHTNANVQDNCKNYVKCLQDKYGYAGMRYDMVKGYGGQYTKIYNQYADVQYSVGEYWDGSYDAVKGWIEATGKTSAAFDFPCKYQINKAFADNDMTQLVWKANGTTDQPAGMIHFGYAQYSVTFVDNHDTYRDGSKFTGNVPAANAFILMSPGTPCVFLPHWKMYKAEIKKLIEIRNAVGIHNMSAVRVLRSQRDCYMAEVTGKNGKAVVKIGDAQVSPEGYSNSDIKASGNGYCVWTKADVGGGGGGGDDPDPGTTPAKLYIIGNIDGAQWSTSASPEMTKDGDKFTAQVTFTAAPGETRCFFNLSDALAADWDALNMTANRYGAATEGVEVTDNSSTPMTAYLNGVDASGCKSWTVAPGTYTVTADFKTMTLSLGNAGGGGGGGGGGGDDPDPDPNTPAQLYIIGNLKGAQWSTTSSPEMTKEGNKFTLQVEFEAAAGETQCFFNLSDALGADWDALNATANRYGAVAEGTTIAVEGTAPMKAYLNNVDAMGCKSWAVAPGKYYVTADFKAMTVGISRTQVGGVEEIGGEAYEGETLWFNLQGQRVDNPGRGVYIRVRGAKAEKVLVD